MEAINLSLVCSFLGINNVYYIMTTAKKRILEQLIKMGGQGYPSTLSVSLLDQMVKDGILSRVNRINGYEFVVNKQYMPKKNEE